MLDNDFLKRIVTWATDESEIRAVVVTGSLSRDDGTTDEWSDLDVQIICREFINYITDDSWLDSLGDVWIRFPLDTHSPYRLVWFAGGKKVDFQFSTVDFLQQMIHSGELSDEYKRGYIVALDKDKLYQTLPPSPHIFPPSPIPSTEAVHKIINEFWFEAVHVAQFIRRRELWVVKFRDWTMKTDLLQMMEWHTQVTSDESINTWILGKRIQQWVDDDTGQAIPQLWSGWDASDCWDSLLAMIDLFSRLAQETTTTLEYPYCAKTYQQITEYILRLRNEDPTSRRS